MKSKNSTNLFSFKILPCKYNLYQIVHAKLLIKGWTKCHTEMHGHHLQAEDLSSMFNYVLLAEVFCLQVTHDWPIQTFGLSVERLFSCTTWYTFYVKKINEKKTDRRFCFLSYSLLTGAFQKM